MRDRNQIEYEMERVGWFNLFDRYRDLVQKSLPESERARIFALIDSKESVMMDTLDRLYGIVNIKVEQKV